MTVRIAEIEQQLRDIWKGFSKEGESNQAITRAQVMNFIAFTSSPAAEPAIAAALADISTQSPGRMIVLIRDESLPASKMNSWVNALCHLASGGRKQICCEQIMIHAGKRDVLQWSSIVLPLLIPDLPVFLWWHDRLDADTELLRVISGACNRLIIDTQSSANLADITALMKLHGPDVAISDLNWARITPWRLALAGFYEHPQCRICIEDVKRIEMDCQSPFEDSGQALLLLSWLGSSLNWQWSQKPQLKNRKGNPVDVVINWHPADIDQLVGVRLISTEGNFKVSLLPDALHLQTEILVREKPVGGQVLKLPAKALSALLGQEVSILTHDVIYERSLLFLGADRII